MVVLITLRDDSDTGASSASQATTAVTGPAAVATDPPASPLPSGPSVIGGSGGDIYALLDKVRPSVVTIDLGRATTNGSVSAGAGSGVVVSSDGLVLTNNHVVQGASAITVKFTDGRSTDATLVGRSPDDDLALIRLRDTTNLVPIAIGTSSAVRVGDDVVAIGNALGLGGTPTVTRGIVSAKHRTITGNGVTLDDLIQTDAAINPGNSGGALVNMQGELIGVNTAIINDAQNIGFAIDIDVVTQVLPELKAANGGVLAVRVLLGVQTQLVSQLQPAEKQRLGITASDGVLVAAVIPGSGAEAAGMRQGDVLVSVDGLRVPSRPALARALRQKAAGDTAAVVVQRAGSTQTLSVKLSGK
ncbi:MAG: S1C family serine protease [Acidimicrobiia bacterium]